MPPRVQTCSRCHVSFIPETGHRPTTACPACGQALDGAAGPGWYAARGSKQVGPAPLEKLRALVEAGRLLPTDLVLAPGQQQWSRAAEVAELFPPQPPAAIQPTPGALLPVPPLEPILPLPGPAIGLAAPALARRRPYELYAALVAVLLCTAVYAWLARCGPPSPAGLIGHGLGVVGFLMMLSTETLYSLRKRVPRINVGRMSTWLRIHVFTGLVGPYLVLLHSAGKFNGLAGALALLTVVMVLSGLVGRYVYTAVPRTLDGGEVAARELEERIAATERQLEALGLDLPAAQGGPGGWTAVLARPILLWRERQRLRRAVRGLPNLGRARAAQLQQLLAERSRLRLQVDSLAAARRLLALWHVLHVPLGVAVFTLAFVHIGAALYYSTLLK
jgi:hypothetical protein